MKRTRLIIVCSVIAALALGWTGGFYYSARQSALNDAIVTEVVNQDTGKSSAVDFSLFWQVWERLHEKYVDQNQLDAQKLVYGAISGMVGAAGDPYTVFFEPETSKEFQESVNGAFSGVGMEIGKKNEAITVIAPIKDSPAIKAGIKAGDVIVKIDGTSTDGLAVDEAVNRIRGKQGTTVVLSIARAGESELLEFSIVRGTVRIPAVDWKLVDGHVAYMQISSFNANVDAEFVKAANEILSSTADRLIIDMRDNPGGLLDSAVNLAGWFIPTNSVVVKEKFGDGTIDELKSNGMAKLGKLPTVILINGGSASAAEILAGALHDLRNLQLIGEKSFGKGSVQQIEGFYNGSSLKVTIAKWLTPNGVSISDTGIAPTIEVKIDPKEYTAKGWQIGVPGKDPQLDKALEVVSGLK